MGTILGLLKLILKMVTAPVVLLLTLAIWICVGLVYVSGLVLGLLSTVIALLGVAVLVTYARLLEEKKKAYAEYRRPREEMRELLAAKANVDRLLNIPCPKRLLSKWE